MLTIIHKGHLGLAKCKLQIKDTVYWLQINVQLEKLVLICELCPEILQYTHGQKL